MVQYHRNPDKDIPISDQIGVSIPNVGDFTLSELQGDLDIDIEVPSIIVDKFPFCIPFDFVRFLGILCADPVAHRRGNGKNGRPRAHEECYRMQSSGPDMTIALLNS